VQNKSAGRLSSEEVEKFLRLAKNSFHASGYVVGSPQHTAQDFWELGLISSEDQTNAINKVF
jgi:hypothetical protein